MRSQMAKIRQDSTDPQKIKQTKTKNIHTQQQQQHNTRKTKALKVEKGEAE